VAEVWEGTAELRRAAGPDSVAVVSPKGGRGTFREVPRYYQVHRWYRAVASRGRRAKSFIRRRR